MIEMMLLESKTINLVLSCFPAKHAALGERAKTSWLRFRIMCPSGATCLSANGCFSDPSL